MRREAIPFEIRKLVNEIYGKKCAICGARKRLHIHHEDEDPNNNDLENLTLLCSECHGMMHPDKFWEIAHYGDK